MDDKLTAISSSNGIVGGESGNADASDSCRKIFSEVFPTYLAMGMSYNEFYREDHELAAAYRKAYEKKRNQDNEDMWRQGLYVYHAISAISPLLIPFSKHPKAEPYLNKPIPMFEKDAEASEESAVEDKGIAYMKAKMIEINKKFGN